MITINEVVERQPMLQNVFEDAKAYMLSESAGYGKRSRHWYQNFKPRLVNLVGFDATALTVQGCSCYDVAYQEFLRIMDI